MSDATRNCPIRINHPRYFTPARPGRPSLRSELSRPRSHASQARHAAKTGRAGPQASRMKPPVPHWAATTSRPASWADQLVSTKRLRSTTKDQNVEDPVSSTRLVVVLLPKSSTVASSCDQLDDVSNPVLSSISAHEVLPAPRALLVVEVWCPGALGHAHSSSATLPARRGRP